MNYPYPTSNSWKAEHSVCVASPLERKLPLQVVIHGKRSIPEEITPTGSVCA
ncbi:MAG: hypothetical protein WBA93_09925 [Microcoleaceae cyanobacterium]